jgi:demethylmenaquinone methyltransferase/2-methoxy-6-polyprenyl-1,4-benzoquinol methylase
VIASDEVPITPGAGLMSPRKEHALGLFSALPRWYDEMGAVMSFGQDPRWRKALVRAVQASPAERVLDVASGTGMVAAALVEKYGCSVVGIDQSQQMLARARRRLEQSSDLAERVEFVQGEAESLPFRDGEFDHLSFTYLLRYVDDPGATLKELARVVKPGGRIATLEFGEPTTPVLKQLWFAHTRLGLPLLGRIASRDWYEVGRFLGPSISGFYEQHPIADIVRMWDEAGMGQIEVKRMSFGAGIVMSGVRRDGN